VIWAERKEVFGGGYRIGVKTLWRLAKTQGKKGKINEISCRRTKGETPLRWSRRGASNLRGDEGSSAPPGVLEVGIEVSESARRKPLRCYGQLGKSEGESTGV